MTGKNRPTMIRDLKRALGVLDTQSLQFDQKTAELFDNIAEALGAVGWEIGPDLGNPQKCCAFSLNAGLSDARLRAISHSIAKIDPVEGWVIYAGLPPKDWEIYFEIEDEEGSAVPVEGSKWYWQMGDASARSHLTLYAPSTLDLSESKLKECGEIIAIGEIGEKNCIEYFSDILVSRRGRGFPKERGVMSVATFARSFAAAKRGAAFGEWLRRKQSGVIRR